MVMMIVESGEQNGAEVMTTKTRIAKIRLWFKNCNVLCPKTRAALRRSVMTIYLRQTSSEQASESTRDSNGVGFNSNDARFGSIMAEKIMALEEGTSPYQDLTPKMYSCIRVMMSKYARQLAETYEEKHSQKT